MLQELEQDENEGVEDRHAEVIAEAEEQYGEDKITRKLEKKLEQLDHKFETNALRSAIETYETKADDIEKALFEDVKADLKSIEDFEKTRKFITDRAQKLREREAELAEAAQAKAEEQAARAWGTGPLGATPPPPSDEEKELMDRIKQGDTAAAFAAIVGDDQPL
jgi:DNA repair exonuclease SbcCD ATPase subunit